MSVLGIESNTTVNALNLQSPAKSVTIKANNLSEISDSFSESSETMKFKEIVGKYDITNMSRTEAGEMCKELVGNGLVSFKDIAFATFDPTRIIPGWQDGVSSVSGWKMSSNPDQKMNFLEGFKIQADWNKQYGNSQFQDRFDKTVELAEKIHHFQTP